MSSIASMRNSVQTNGTQKTNSSQETNETQKTNRNQKQETIQEENIHIASETTPDEQNEYNEQYETMQNETGKSNKYPYKYKYEIFDGYAGEEYLKGLVREILPAALYRTWEIAVRFQAPSNACYVGVGKIAEKAKRGERQIQKDRREMELRELLRRYAGPVLVKEPDGTWSRKVRIINDFGGLYDLAYEYHLWKTSAEYVEAEWEAADYIREDEELYEKLIRFDCYRRILVCEKRGPKTELSDLHKAYKKRRERNEQEVEQSQDGQQEAKTTNYLPNQIVKKSSYEETKIPKKVIPKRDSSDSKKDSEEAVFGSACPPGSIDPKTIRNNQQSIQDERSTKAQTTPIYEEKRNRQENIQHNAQRGSKVNDLGNLTEKEMPRAGAAKDVIDYTIEDIMNNPLAVLTFLQQIYAAEQAKAHKQEQARAAKAQRHQQARAD